MVFTFFRGWPHFYIQIMKLENLKRNEMNGMKLSLTYQVCSHSKRFFLEKILVLKMTELARAQIIQSFPE
jgi:hypothetical protein